MLMELKTAVSSRVIELLNERNWTAYRLSLESGVPKTTVSNIILGKCKSCNLNTMLNLCRGFRIQLIDFIRSDMFLLENLDDND